MTFLSTGRAKSTSNDAASWKMTAARFPSDAEHATAVAQRIAAAVGRRVNETSPLCDARLADGSRVNIVLGPLALKGPVISIRKFSKRSISLDIMARQGNMSEPLARLLEIVARARLNVVISGGTGSGKTTLLNAMSALIDPTERIITIEDAAELQLQQPHVVPLETRPPNLEGTGEINQRELLKKRTAYASRSHHPWRDSRHGSLRHAAGHEHRP
ncbi:MAG: ATPase, T2SS/T4P/T4SS family [Aliidongia sp.]